MELDALHVYTNLKLIASPTFDNIRAAIQIQLQVPFPLLEQRLQKGDFNAFQNYDPENYVHNTSMARALVPIERFTEQRDQTHIWPVRLWRALGSFVQRTWLLRDQKYEPYCTIIIHSPEAENSPIDANWARTLATEYDYKLVTRLYSVEEIEAFISLNTKEDILVDTVSGLTSVDGPDSIVLANAWASIQSEDTYIEEEIAPILALPDFNVSSVDKPAEQHSVI